MKPFRSKGCIIGCTLTLLIINYNKAQAPVEALFASYKATPTGLQAYTATPAPNSGTFNNCNTQVSSYSFNNGSENALLLSSIQVDGFNFSMANNTPAIIKLRRVNNATVQGLRSIIFLESMTGPAHGCPTNKQYQFKSPYHDDMESFLNNNYVNQGTDNIFTNAGNADGNNNNIERVDVIFPNGVSSASATEAGFALFDRGVDKAHDPFRIAAIIAIDPNGNPTAFGPVRTCIGGNGASNGSWGHPSLQNGNRDLSVYVMRKEVGENQLRSSAAINQQLGGVFFSLADLGIQAGQVIYGYALLSTDGVANPTTAQLLNINDPAVYPLATNEAVGGGLDLIAVNAFFQTGVTLTGQEVQLKGSWKDERPVLQWTLKEVPNGSRAELQQAPDGRNFTSVYAFTVQSSYFSAAYTDDSQQGFTYYRLKIETPDKQLIYSKTVQVNGHYHDVQLFPTRIQPSQSVRIKGLPDGLYTALISSALGTTYVASVKVQNGLGLIEPPRAAFAKGLYYVTVRGAEGVEGGAKLVVY